jgi:hypothetical protein
MYDWKNRMQKIAGHFAEQLHAIRTGTVDRGVNPTTVCVGVPPMSVE